MHIKAIIEKSCHKFKRGKEGEEGMRGLGRRKGREK